MPLTHRAIIALASALLAPAAAFSQTQPVAPVESEAPSRPPEGPLFTTDPHAPGGAAVTITSDERDTVVSVPRWYGDTTLCVPPCALYATGRAFSLAIRSPSHPRSVHDFDGRTPVRIDLSTRDRGRALGGSLMLGLGTAALVVSGFTVLPAATTGGAEGTVIPLAVAGVSLGVMIAGGVLLATSRRNVVAITPDRGTSAPRWLPAVQVASGGAVVGVASWF